MFPPWDRKDPDVKLNQLCIGPVDPQASGLRVAQCFVCPLDAGRELSKMFFDLKKMLIVVGILALLVTVGVIVSELSIS